jgi:hypothetical protein
VPVPQSSRLTLASSLVCRAALAYATFVHAQVAPPADAPEALRVPAGEKLLFRAHASGAQIYVCGRTADGKPQWTLKAPDAVLRGAKGALIGHHSAGPSWKLNDGSEVTGKAVARADSPDPGSIPWLLLAAVSHSGKGQLERVTSIQRLHTRGGRPPPDSRCDPATKQNKEARVPYRADYYFYGPVEKGK